MTRKVTFAEAELSVQRLFVGEKEFGGARDPENGVPKPPEGVIVQIKKVLAPELESIFSNILGEEECLSLVLTPACPRRRVSVWCADACILDASSIELLKEELTMASDKTRPNPPAPPSSEQGVGDERVTGPDPTGREGEPSKGTPSESRLEKLVSSFSHEVGNHLNAILMTAKLAALTVGKAASDTDELRARLETISHEAEISGRLLKTLSRLSKRWRVPPGHHDLDDVVRRWNKTRDAERQGPPVELHLCGELPPLRLDPSSIEAMLGHLIRNAEEAGAGRNIDVRTEKRGDRARLIVRDDGPGIPPEHSDRLFDPFFSTRREEGALGLGLTLVGHMVGEHGGTIEVTSTPGEGTAVVVELPLAEPGGDEE